MTTHLGLQRIMIPGAQASALTTGSISLAGARGQFVEDTVQDSWYNIATVTASGGEQSLTLSSIPQTYKHLQLRFHLRDSASGLSTGAFSQLYFNSDTTSGDYSYSRIYSTYNAAGTVSATRSNTASYLYIAPGINNAQSSGYGPFGVYSVAIMDIYDYANTSKFRSGQSIAGFGNDSTTIAYTGGISNFSYNKTSAINSITLNKWIDGFMAGSYIALYGIKAAR